MITQGHNNTMWKVVWFYFVASSLYKTSQNHTRVHKFIHEDLIKYPECNVTNVDEYFCFMSRQYIYTIPPDLIRSLTFVDRPSKEFAKLT